MANTYDTYKDSGIAWIGEIPSEWNVECLGKLGTFTASGIDKKVNESEEPIRIINYTDVYGNSSHELIEKNYMMVTAPHDKCRDHQVKVGDMIFTPSSETIEDIGVSAVVMDELPNTAYSYHVLRFRSDKIDNVYKKYICNNAFVQNYFSSKAIGSIRKTLCRQDFKDCKVVVPPLSTQLEIGNYLNKISSEIDSLISLQEEMISELQAYKQSVITEAVTKGLDKKAKMKNSGVEWIGDIPEDWKLPQLRFVTSKIGSGSTPTGGANVYVNEGVKFLRSQNVYNEGFKLDDVAYITPETHNQMSGTKVLEGDILFNITGGSIGRCCLVDANLGEANVNQHVSIVRPSSIYGKYLMYYLQSEAGQMQVNILQTGGNREGLSASAFSEFHICVPSPNEQHSIATYLDEKTSQIDSLIALKQSKIESLKEYKKSIIYEYVTGKKRV